VTDADVHAVGNKIFDHAFTAAGFEVVNLGVMLSQEEYIEAAVCAKSVRGREYRRWQAAFWRC